MTEYANQTANEKFLKTGDTIFSPMMRMTSEVTGFRWEGSNDTSWVLMVMYDGYVEPIGNLVKTADRDD